MQVLFAIIAVILALWVVAWLTMAGVMWILLPAMVVVLPLCAIAGLVWGLTVSILTLCGYQPWQPRLVTAAAVERGSADLARPRRPSPFGRDPGWPSYLVAQSRVDLRSIWTRMTRQLTTGWQKINELPNSSGVVWTWVPVILLGYPAWLVVNIGALLATGVTLAVGGAVLLVPWVGWLGIAGALRIADHLVRRIRHAGDGSCPTCYHVFGLPAFQCPSCDRLHRDLRPGRLGAVWRRCVCGALLPTTVLRGAHALVAVCPNCLEPLQEGAAVRREIRVPVFGPVSAGKTRLLYAGLLAISDRAAAIGGSLTFSDERSRATFENGARIISDGDDTAKTAAGQLPAAVTAQITLPRRKAVLHLFDAAGEFYIDRGDNSELQFLDFAQGLVFVIDPFSMPWVQDQLGGFGQVIMARANAAVDDPEQVYHVTAGRLRDYQVKTGSQRLAVAVVKSDLLADLPLAQGLRPDSVRDWLGAAGLDNLVLAAERDFAEVRYFMVASMAGVLPDNPMSPIGPFAWLMSKAGIGLLPDETAAAEQTQEAL